MQTYFFEYLQMSQFVPCLLLKTLFRNFPYISHNVIKLKKILFLTCEQTLVSYRMNIALTVLLYRYAFLYPKNMQVGPMSP